ncbi:MAG: glycosyltransferase family 4 protein [Candidatus Sumerlaeia bacterium]
MTALSAARPAQGKRTCGRFKILIARGRFNQHAQHDERTTPEDRIPKRLPGVLGSRRALYLKPTFATRPVGAIKPLKIFHINMHRHWGGQPNRTLTEARELARRGHDVVVAGPHGSLLVARARAAGLRTFDDLRLQRGLRPRAFWSDWRRLRALFCRERFDIIHTHGSQDTWVCALALLGLNPRPCFIRSRHNTFPVAPHLFNKWLYARVIDHVITISPQVIPLLTEPGLCTPDKCTAIFSVPDAEVFRPAPPSDALRRELGLSPDQLVVGCVARLAPEKGHRYLIAAAPAVIAAVPNVRFLFVGKGRSQPDLEARIEQLKLRDRFVFAGFRHNVADFLNLMDVFVLCPVSGESLGTSILEAFLTERPVVATDVGGVRESVRDGITGFLVPPAEPAPLADRLITLLRDPALRRRFGQAGREMVQREFTVERLGDETETVYGRVMKNRRGE